MSIEKIVSEAQTFAEVLPIIERAKPRLSCLGTRYVYVSYKNESGVLSIDALANRVVELIDKNPDFNEQERLEGKRVAELIDKSIYDASDSQVKNACCCTRLFVWIREGIIFMYRYLRYYQGASPHWPWKYNVVISESGYQDVFDMYTEKQFLDKFQCFPKDFKGLEYMSYGMSCFDDVIRYQVSGRR